MMSCFRFLNNKDYQSEYDGKIVKTYLPEEIKQRFFTKNQWLEKGFEPKENATVYEMHPTSLNKKICFYYLDTEVQKLPASTNCCSNCKNYKNRYCIIAGGHVSPSHYCSEHEGK